MKKFVSVVLAALIILPVLALSGCACDGDRSHGKAHHHHGGKM